MKLSDLFDEYRLRGLNKTLERLGTDPSFWLSKSPREAERSLPSEAEDIVRRRAKHDDEGIILLDRLRARDPDVSLPVLERYLGSAFEAKRLTTDEKYFAACSEATETTVLESIMRDFVLPCLIAESSESEEGSDARRLLDLLKRSGSVALTRICIQAGDQMAESDETQGAIRLYRRAIEAAPRPDLHVELGALLLYRCGLEPEQRGYTNSYLLLRERYVDQYELLDERLLYGPTVPGARALVLDLALNAYARAYGYFLSSAGTDTPAGQEQRTVSQVFDILEGLSSIFLERDEPTEVEEVFDEYDSWKMLANDLEVGPDDEDYSLRLGYNLGLARGRTRGRAVDTAETHLGLATNTTRMERPDEDKSHAQEHTSADEERRSSAYLADQLGTATWRMLPTRARQELEQAELFFAHKWPESFNWRGAAEQYCFAIETLLAETVGERLKEHVRGNPLQEKQLHPYHVRASLFDYAELFDGGKGNPAVSSFLEENFADRRPELRHLARGIRRVNKFRKGHPGLPIGKGAAEALRDLLIIGERDEPPLLRRLAEACH